MTDAPYNPATTSHAALRRFWKELVCAETPPARVLELRDLIEAMRTRLNAANGAQHSAADRATVESATALRIIAERRLGSFFDGLDRRTRHGGKSEYGETLLRYHVSTSAAQRWTTLARASDEAVAEYLGPALDILNTTFTSEPVADAGATKRRRLSSTELLRRIRIYGNTTGTELRTRDDANGNGTP